MSRTNTKDLTIKLDKKGFHANRQFMPQEALNKLLIAIMQLFKLSTVDADEQYRASVFALVSTGMNNALAQMAPDLYFPTDEQMQSEVERTAKLAELFPDVADTIADIRKDLDKRIDKTVQTDVAVDDSGYATALENVKESKEDFDEDSES